MCNNPVFIQVHTIQVKVTFFFFAYTCIYTKNNDKAVLQSYRQKKYGREKQKKQDKWA